MKNIHLLPTDKPSRLHKYNFEGFALSKEALNWREAYNIYITSDEVIKDVRPHKGKWHLEGGKILNKFPDYLTDLSECKLVIMTTDTDLIKDGVQEIDNEFLEWFIKNPSCESVEVENERIVIDDINYNFDVVDYKYKIIIPKEEPKQDLPTVNGSYGCTIQTKKQEPKQETLEEFYQRQLSLGKYQDQESAIKYSILAGAKWQQERMYSEENLHNAFYNGWLYRGEDYQFPKAKKEWFEQFKKKNKI